MEKPKYTVGERIVWGLQDAMMGIIDPIRNGIEGLLDKAIGQPKSRDIPYLPPSMRFALSHNAAQVGVREIMSILEPQFYGMGVYLGMRIFDPLPNEKRELLEGILEASKKGPDYTEVNRFLADQLMQHQDQLGTTNATKTSQISRIGYDHCEQLFSKMARRIKESERTPAMIAHSSLIGLKPFADEMGDGEDLYIVEPNNGHGYRVDYRGGGFSVEKKEAFQFDQLEGRRVTAVDDTIRSGETIGRIKRIIEAQTHLPVDEECLIRVT